MKPTDKSIQQPIKLLMKIERKVFLLISEACWWKKPGSSLGHLKTCSCARMKILHNKSTVHLLRVNYY